MIDYNKHKETDAALKEAAARRLGKEKAMQWLGTTIEEDEERRRAVGVTVPDENVSVGGGSREPSEEDARTHYEEMRKHWKKSEGIASDGSTASYYFLPKDATELYQLIIYKNMNAQIGEIFRSAYRYGESSHSDMLRDARKIKSYAEQEIERLERKL